MSESAQPAGSKAPEQNRRKALPKLLLGAVGLAALIWLGRSAGGQLDELRAWIEGLGAWAPAVFIGVYVASVAAFVPASALTIGAGALFGLARGTLYAFVAASLGAALAFLIARYLARNAIEQRIQGDRRFAAIDRAVGREGLKIVALLRLSPVFPFNLLNYALGLTRVRLRDYLIASLAMLPGTLLYVYLGSLATDLASAAAGEGAGTAQLALLGVGLVATVAVVTVVVRAARRALAEATGDELEENPS